ncbi:MAG: DNA primase catalytic subunit PriS [Thermoplasmatota archaeon]
MGFAGGLDLPPELVFMKDAFRSYYSNNPVQAPERFTRREWGFFPFGGKMMFRHIAFIRKDDLDGFFKDTVPMHAYYSTAYYNDPSLQPMGEKVKTWMGADLIFDLDADHLPDADEMTYTQQLKVVKEEVKKLLEKFILGDLGFPEENTHLYFSGGRGYHVHVRDPNILNLDSRDRRQIVDYITGKNIDFNILFPEKVKDYNPRFRSYKITRKFRNREYGGWVKKTYEGRDELIHLLEKLPDKKSRINTLLKYSNKKKLQIKEKKCETIINDLFYDGDGKTYQHMIEKDIFTHTKLDRIDKEFLQLSASFSSLDLSGETDEPVTTDIKRLIRCPGSLHGKTGLKVVKVPLDGIDEFDPLRDAVALPDDPVSIVLKERTDQELGGAHHHFEPGEQEVPTYLAYFLVARRIAVMGDSDTDH